VDLKQQFKTTIQNNNLKQQFKTTSLAPPFLKVDLKVD
jgi:hypothetical protein